MQQPRLLNKIFLKFILVKYKAVYCDGLIFVYFRFIITDTLFLFLSSNWLSFIKRCSRTNTKGDGHSRAADCISQKVAGTKVLPYLFFLFPNLLIFGFFPFMPSFTKFGFSLNHIASINFSSREYPRLDNLAAFQKLTQATNNKPWVSLSSGMGKDSFYNCL